MQEKSVGPARAFNKENGGEKNIALKFAKDFYNFRLPVRLGICMGWCPDFSLGEKGLKCEVRNREPVCIKKSRRLTKWLA